MLTLLKSGSAGIDQFLGHSGRLGNAFGRLDVAKIEAANDAISDMHFLWNNVKSLLAIELAPIVEALAIEMTDMFNNGAGGADGFKRSIRESVEWTTALVSILADATSIIRRPFDLVAVAIYELIELQAKMTRGFLAWAGLPIPEFIFDTQEFASGAGGFAWDNLTADLPSIEINKRLESIKKHAEEAARALHDKPKGEGGGTFIDDTIKAIESASSLKDKLQDQIDTFGMSANAAEIYRLSIKGVDEATLNQIRALDMQLEALQAVADQEEEMKQKQDDLAKSAWDIFNSTRTPLEEFQQKVAEIEEVFSKGLIDSDTFNRALDQAANAVPDDQKQTSGPKLSGAFASTSLEARSAVLRNRLGSIGNDPNKQTAKNTALLVTEMKKVNTNLQKFGGPKLAQADF